MPSVVVVDRGAGVVLDAVIFFSEIFGRGGRNQRLEFADRDFFDCRLEHKGAGRHAGAEADDQDGFGVLMKQRGNVAEHALQAHIGERGGSFHFSADVEVAVAVGRFGNRHRVVAALADVQRASGIGLQHHAPAVGDGEPRDG